jgi:hypothetical protein
MRSSTILLGAVVVLGACDGDTALPVEADCNPLGASGCLTPWPSSSLGTDGFSPSMPITMEVDVAVDPSSLVLPDATVLLDLTTSTRVAHVATIEARPDDVQAIRLWPTAPLPHAHRFAVAITDAVVTLDGEALDSPPGFTALVDDRYTDHDLLEAMRPRFGETLDALEESGLDLDSLVVAWDFATR